MSGHMLGPMSGHMLCHMSGYGFSHSHMFVSCEVQVTCSLVIMCRGEHSLSQYPLFRVVTPLMTNQGYPGFEGEVPGW